MKFSDDTFLEFHKGILTGARYKDSQGRTHTINGNNEVITGGN